MARPEYRRDPDPRFPGNRRARQHLRLAQAQQSSRRSARRSSGSRGPRRSARMTACAAPSMIRVARTAGIETATGAGTQPSADTRQPADLKGKMPAAHVPQPGRSRRRRLCAESAIRPCRMAPLEESRRPSTANEAIRRRGAPQTKHLQTRATARKRTNTADHHKPNRSRKEERPGGQGRSVPGRRDRSGNRPVCSDRSTDKGPKALIARLRPLPRLAAVIRRRIKSRNRTC